MPEGQFAKGIVAGRLTPEQYADNFSDLHQPFSEHEARVEADRCYFCYDAPCMTACPTSIDIPMFIRQIATGNPLGSAKTIFDQNILGGMCARVCPTETLCEEVCVREVAEGKPVQIGRLQRYSTDVAIAQGVQFYERAEPTGKKIAVIGAGPAGLACAHRLAVKGHEVTIYDAREKAGGLNEYGIAAYKTTDNFAQAEVDYVTAIGGIAIENGKALGRDVSLSDLASRYDAVFLGLGLGGVNALRSQGEEAASNAVDYIAGLRQASDLSAIPVGRRVVVIGGGMTAIDVAVQAKLLGAEDVTICYRRGKDQMNASLFEQDLAAATGVTIRHWLAPRRVLADGDNVSGIELEYTRLDGDTLVMTGETMTLEADQVFKAIGQTFAAGALNGSGAQIELEGGRIKVDAEGRTSLDKVWAGGDCVAGGEDLTVSAVAMGRDAAESMHRALMGGQNG
ncbi:NAD(P)-dependent oxidoreductase [Pelagibacterium lentulum]|uniref:dihydrouracil dehydrogenase (NAD(+)) n=1 Tax=Pelagibacterium lentulum TaxID=2029865 RepID=A0A916RBK1_9HYPH|nr:NAD(P)-dependent oxidoreductase [Pelagibacterium lentulum]GGA44489.1 dihydropyrimidine dehydrogenase subunit A [Pelagibacterium lentulum]